jgi:hypothetical protein
MSYTWAMHAAVSSGGMDWVARGWGKPCLGGRPGDEVVLCNLEEACLGGRPGDDVVLCNLEDG